MTWRTCEQQPKRFPVLQLEKLDGLSKSSVVDVTTRKQIHEASLASPDWLHSRGKHRLITRKFVKSVTRGQASRQIETVELQPVLQASVSPASDTANTLISVAIGNWFHFEFHREPIH